MSELLTFPIRSDKLAMQVRTSDHIAHRRSKFQDIDVYQSETFGKILLLDGHVQLTEFDEHAYHEALVQIPLMSLDAPQRALVVGGGDGGVVRELCKQRSLTRIDLVEIDSDVIEVSKQHLTSVNGGCFEDPRVCVFIEDAFGFVKQSSDSYDLIVIDSTDTYEDEVGALSEMLFTSEFYADCRRLLSEQGFVVTQADNPVFCPYSLASVTQLFQTVFPQIGAYYALVPSFGGHSAFVWGSGGAALRQQFSSASTFRYLNDATYRLAFLPPRF